MTTANIDVTNIMLTKQLIKHLESEEGFGKTTCKTMNVECANCKGQMLLGYLNWYLDLLEWDMKEERISKMIKKTAGIIKPKKKFDIKKAYKTNIYERTR